MTKEQRQFSLEKACFLFLSTMSGSPWGGSEELWSQAAAKLVDDGFFVSASIHPWMPRHSQSTKLEEYGVDVRERPSRYPRLQRAAYRIFSGRTALHLAYMDKFLTERNPVLLVISNGGALPPIDLVELCVERRQPFVTIAQFNSDQAEWPDDDIARRYRKTLAAAHCCYFVSDANRRLTERQIGGELVNAEVVRNPFKVPFQAQAIAPTSDGRGELRFACVARLHPSSKGQDILFQALASQQWRTRNWQLTLYGEGPCKESLTRLAEQFGLGTRVEFAGHVDDLVGIWSRHDVLILPSRAEGIPLALVEAMLCGRPVIATDVGGNAELIADGVTGFLASAPTVPAVRHAMERAWQRRGELQDIGALAARHIRQLVPPDPARVFADKLKDLAGIHTVQSRATPADRNLCKQLNS